ncbi:glutamyl-tRNA(Gln) amidotransferase, C subunit [Alkaliphilus metalliredigens QYMF]|uniref:Aspartyl/glutamyl-tRNA(Asn/Gln) amidotransferase subunit C n=1 Tax=Alkaliphilus metalliredigens (strain QYMF) TaxID=293826 RepID=A6TTJ9_ALKMQ|nr:Asp-tRNA(Asn)/Glu-tRNA(Gln) amidotransferase subunit GatC [Alkaliphilus metalliredigens]ABR49517.1 glutamyl-tRNA(Gln) amidotransferase, C subunit [Alkaliphilus metalliredigens QYMF]
MKVNIETINYIAKLAKLKFTEEEAIDFANEFEGILSHFESIDNEDLTEIDFSSQAYTQSVLREDISKNFENKKALLKNAKGMKDNYIVIPKVIE